MIAKLASLNTEYCVNLFLLWLLYRFTKPEKKFKDGQTEASALLFAHDSKKVKEILSSKQEQNEEDGNVEKLENEHKEFYNFIIKDLIAGITTETAVTLEFMD